jgi:hypothetical protein
VRIVFCLILVGLLAAVSQGQDQTPKPAAKSADSTFAPEKKAAPAADRVILKVGNLQVTQAEFESGIGSLEPQGDADQEVPAEKNRRRLGDDYASVLMLSQQAVAKHLDSSPEVSHQLAIDRIQILSDAEFASLMRQAQPTQEEITQYYSTHLSEYDEVQIRRLFIWKRKANSKDGAGLSPQDARARADEILQASAARRDPTKLAENFKDSKDALLDTAPSTFPRGELPAPMEKVAFAMTEGVWSEVEDTPERIVLVELVKRSRQKLESVSYLIEQHLQGEKMQAMLDELKKNAGIWMDEKYFGTAVAPVPGAKRRMSDPPSELQKSARKEESNNNDQQQK